MAKLIIAAAYTV